MLAIWSLVPLPFLKSFQLEHLEVYFTIYIYYAPDLEKETATHSSVLAWRIPGTEEPGGLPSMGSHRVGHDWSDLAAAAAGYVPKSGIAGSYFCFIDCAKVFGCVDHNKLWKILKEMGLPDQLTCLLRNLYEDQEATWTWNNRLVPNRKRSMSRLYIVTLLIKLICRVHHEKRWAGKNTSWNQDCQEKYQ